MAEFPQGAGADRLADHPAALKAELKVDLRPTLFIGAGGTGMEVMMRIRRHILSAVWNRQHPTRVESIADFPVARFLHFDLDHHAVIDEGKSLRTDPWYDLSSSPTKSAWWSRSICPSTTSRTTAWRAFP